MKSAFVLLSALCLLAVSSRGALASGACSDPAGAAPCFAPDNGSPTTYPRPPAATQPLKLHHISLFTPNHERLANWYRDMLGFVIAGRVTAKRPDGVDIEIIRLTMDGIWLNISGCPA